jgi:Rad3-related DNA helicase
MSLSSFFPAGYTPNSQQAFILSEIEKAQSKGLKFIVINAPTGSGKSMIAKTLANSTPSPSASYLEYVRSGAIYELDEEELEMFEPVGTAVLTMTKTLQDQYSKLFNDCAVLKGKGNYPCSLSSSLSCDLGPCNFSPEQKEQCLNCGLCEYYNKRDEAVSSECGLYSYAMFMALPEACQMKKVLVCDEASELEDLLVQSFTIPFNFKILSKLNLDIPVTPVQGAPYEQYILWLRSVKNEVYSAYRFLCNKYRKQDLSKAKKEEQLKYRALTALNNTCDKVLDIIGHTEFIIEHNKDELNFKPLRVDKIARTIFNKSELVVLMSATIIDHANFTKQLGIGKNEYAYIEAESTFDPKKAPIKLGTSVYVTYSNKAVTIPKLAAVAKEICNIHSNQKGIIHTHTLAITNEIQKACGTSSRFLYREKGVSNEKLINKHVASEEPTVLVSPSMTHGIDLKGDLGEFAIIVKAPFLPLGDERIKRLAKEDVDWYNDKMISSFIQMCGRTIRSSEDTSITYVLDATLTKKLLEMKDKLPKYIIERFC